LDFLNRNLKDQISNTTNVSTYLFTTKINGLVVNQIYKWLPHPLDKIHLIKIIT
jgi:hypothetical protein